jgi:N-acetylneuraminic acid mutarotase
MIRFVCLVGLTMSIHAAEPEFAPLPKGTTSFGAAVSDGYVYFYGGHTGKPHSYSNETTSGKFYRLSLTNPIKWEELPSGPAVQGVAVVAHAGKIYRIGGMQPRNKPTETTDSHSLASAARYVIKSGKWEDLPDMPEGRSSHDAVILNDMLYVAGGWQMNGAGKESVWHKSALKLDFNKSPLKWEVIEQPFQRRALTMAEHGGKVYVIAGLNASGTAERTVNFYDPTSKSWSKAVDIPEGAMNGFTPAACSCDGQLYLSPADGKVYRLSEKGDAWVESGVLKLSRVVHRMVPIAKSQMLVLGGSAKGSPTADVEMMEVRK